MDGRANVKSFEVYVKVIIAGSRKIEDLSIVEKAIAESGFLIAEVVSGGAMGVDSLAEQWAAENDMPVSVFKPDWSQYGRGAGPVRNAEMTDYAEALIAVWDGESKGTRDMIDKAEKKGLPVFVCHHSNSKCFS
jgi:hypothetical protein